MDVQQQRQIILQRLREALTMKERQALSPAQVNIMEKKMEKELERDGLEALTVDRLKGIYLETLDAWHPAMDGLIGPRQPQSKNSIN